MHDIHGKKKPTTHSIRFSTVPRWFSLSLWISPSPIIFDNFFKSKNTERVQGPFSGRIIRSHLIQTKKHHPLLPAHFSKVQSNYVFRQETVGTYMQLSLVVLIYHTSTIQHTRSNHSITNHLGKDSSSSLLLSKIAAFFLDFLYSLFLAVKYIIINYLKTNKDTVLGQAVHKEIPLSGQNSTFNTPKLTSKLLSARSTKDKRSDVQQFADLLSKCFTLDPSKRITVRSALKHDFFRSSTSS